jgi:hypothetical protein
MPRNDKRALYTHICLINALCTIYVYSYHLLGSSYFERLRVLFATQLVLSASSVSNVYEASTIVPVAMSHGFSLAHGNYSSGELAKQRSKPSRHICPTISFI